uniref:Transmembrane domain-containing protein n=1 Tax=Spironucleus salmonicida TaxID=348837 RepID=V6LF61_9EUKA|eukprot:EST42918.1 Transmembrane domain-containing protein [Spironucleus salmonicida]
MVPIGRTSVYTIRIGPNEFRSEFIVYNAFANANITLQPTIGSFSQNASSYVISSYEIMFLDNYLIQESVVDDFVVVIYEYNGCVSNPSVSYESFESIVTKIQTNPNCTVTPTSDLMYYILLHGSIIQQKNITKDKYDFFNFNQKNQIVQMAVKNNNNYVYLRPYKYLETILQLYKFQFLFLRQLLPKINIQMIMEYKKRKISHQTLIQFITFLYRNAKFMMYVLIQALLHFWMDIFISTKLTQYHYLILKNMILKILGQMYQNQLMKVVIFLIMILYLITISNKQLSYL